MHDTLSTLVRRALKESPRPLEFYLREQSHLPGSRANLGLVGEVCDEMASYVPQHSRQVWDALHYLAREEQTVETNTPGEFVVLCGVVAFGACATVHAEWHADVCVQLARFAGNASWRVREGAAIAFQRMLTGVPEATVRYLRMLAREGDCLQQRASAAAIAEPLLLHGEEIKTAALEIQQVIVRRFRDIPLSERKRDDVRVLRQALGYSLSVVAAALPEQGFALMRECASWGDPDMVWVIRENLKKKRLAKFTEQTAYLARMLA